MTIRRSVAAVLAGVLVLLTSHAGAQSAAPSPMEAMPSAQRVRAEITGSDPVDTSARQMAAFRHLQQIIDRLAGVRAARNEFTRDETRLKSEYFSAWQRYQFADNLPPASERPRWEKLQAVYEADPALRNELLQRFFGPEFRAQYSRSTQTPPPQAGTARPSPAAVPAPATSRPAPAEASVPSRQRPPVADRGAELKAYLAEGDRLLKETRYEQALDRYQKAAALDSSSLPALWGVAAAAGSAGRTTTQLAALTRITTLTPDDFDAFLALGIFSVQQRRFKEAVPALTRAIRLRAGSAEAHNQLGVAYSSLGQLPEAVAALQQAVRLQPDSAGARHNLGTVYITLQRYPEAVSELQAAIRIDRNRTGSHHNLGSAYLRSGRRDEALAVYETLKTRDPARAQRLLDEITAAGRVPAK